MTSYYCAIVMLHLVMEVMAVENETEDARKPRAEKRKLLSRRLMEITMTWCTVSNRWYVFFSLSSKPNKKKRSLKKSVFEVLFLKLSDNTFTLLE